MLLWSIKDHALFRGLLQTSVHNPWESGGHEDRRGKWVWCLCRTPNALINPQGFTNRSPLVASDRVSKNSCSCRHLLSVLREVIFSVSPLFLLFNQSHMPGTFSLPDTHPFIGPALGAAVQPLLFPSLSGTSPGISSRGSAAALLHMHSLFLGPFLPGCDGKGAAIPRAAPSSSKALVIPHPGAV